MKIENGPLNILIPRVNVKKLVETRPTEAAKPADSAFSVMLSKAAEKAAAPVQTADEIRQARIVEIRAQLAAGTYNISGRDVANKILSLLKG